MINSKITLYLLSFPIGMMGIVQSLFALSSLLIFHDHHAADFFIPAAVMLAVSASLITLSRRFNMSKVGFRDALLYAVLTWTITGFLGAAPIILITGVSFTDGVFESISALTTTGATILSNLDSMSKSFLMYRQFLQWLGGLGVVIFVVAVLPMLNVGGMRLLKAETPGPIKDDKLSPRIANTAHYLWFVYLTLTALCAVSYYLGGMTAFDAVAHSLTTVSTGGFSTHDASMGYFNSPVILMIADVFMLLGAISFALHFKVWRARKLFTYWRDEETRIFIIIVLVLSSVITFVLVKEKHYDSFFSAASSATFHLISFITSTGYGAGNFTEWPAALTLLLVFAGYLGGCAGSTAGGNKIIRCILSVKLIGLEMQRIMRPYGVFVIKYQGRPVESSVLNATGTFMSITAVCSMTLTLSLMATGLDFWSAFTAVAACLNVLGPAYGVLGSNFQPVSDAGMWILSGAMILGRLEYFTVLALLLPGFWRN